MEIATRPQLDELPAHAVVELLLDAESHVVPAVRAQAQHIATAATLVATRLADGGRLAFAGAGTSGRVAAAEAAELPGTFGLARDRILIRVAGGLDASDDAEDDLELAAADTRALALRTGDVLVAVAASGSTPYTVAVAHAAQKAGADVVAVTGTGPSALAELADVAIEICLAPEVLRGSSRLAAGTAQKLTLNALTTAAMASLGRVHGDLMVDVVPANAKLRLRLADIVAEVAGCPADDALAALETCDGSGRAAVLHLVRGMSPSTAATLAAEHPRLRDALAAPLTSGATPDS